MANAVAAVAYSTDQHNEAQRYHRAATQAANAALKFDSTVPEHVLERGSDIGGGFVLRAPLLYDLEKGDHGYVASAANGKLNGYGHNRPYAVKHLLANMLEVFTTLNEASEDDLDVSAVRLRDLLRRMIRRDDA